jgi:hypothetical protein
MKCLYLPSAAVKRQNRPKKSDKQMRQSHKDRLKQEVMGLFKALRDAGESHKDRLKQEVMGLFKALRDAGECQ